MRRCERSTGRGRIQRLLSGVLLAWMFISTSSGGESALDPSWMDGVQAWRSAFDGNSWDARLQRGGARVTDGQAGVLETFGWCMATVMHDELASTGVPQLRADGRYTADPILVRSRSAPAPSKVEEVLAKMAAQEKNRAFPWVAKYFHLLRFRESSLPRPKLLRSMVEEVEVGGKKVPMRRDVYDKDRSLEKRLGEVYRAAVAREANDPGVLLLGAMRADDAKDCFEKITQALELGIEKAFPEEAYFLAASSARELGKIEDARKWEALLRLHLVKRRSSVWTRLFKARHFDFKFSP